MEILPSVLAACPGVVFAIGSSGEYLYISRETANAAGIHSEAVIGKTEAEISDVPPLIRLDPNKVREAVSNGTPVAYDVSLPSPHGIISLKRTLSPIQFLSKEVIALVVSDRNISDLTKNKEVLSRENEDLRRSQTAYRRLFESDMLGLFSWDLNGTIFDLNQAFLDIVGYSREDISSGKVNWRKLTPAEWVEQDNVAIQELYRRGVSAPFEKEYYRKDGGRVPALLGVAFFEGSKTQGIGFVLDMSARKKAELDLQESEEHFRTLAEALPLIVWANAPDGTLEYRNRQWSDFFGTLVVASLDETIRTRTHPEDVAEALKRWWEAKASGKPFELVARLRTRAGVYRWQLIRALPLLTEQKKTVMKWVGTSTDIDDSKKAERTQTFLSDVGPVLSSSLQYDSILKAVTRLAVPSFADFVLVDILDQNGRLNDISIALQDVDTQEIQVWKFQRSSHEGDQINPILEVIRSGKPDLQTEMPPESFQRILNDHQEGLKFFKERLRPISYLSVPLVARGRSLGAITLFYSFGRRYLPQDLFLVQQFANRASLAIDNSKLFQEAQDAIRIRDEFLSIASHELKTPVTSLRSLIELLLLGMRQWVNSAPQESFKKISLFSSPERLLRMLESSNKQITRLVKLMNNLLDVSRISAGKLDLELSDVNLRDLVREVLEVMRPEMEQAKCPVRLNEPAGMLEHPIIGRWDRYRLEQVIVNLLSNAIKYGAEKPVHITIETNEDKVRIIVQDFGIGISSQYLPRIFNRFERAGLRDGALAGLGLGLYISKQIIEAHAGSISVESEQGKGSKFTVELSLRR